MDITLFVPYSYASPETDFKYEGREITAEEYSKKMVAAYEKYKRGIDETNLNNAWGTNVASRGYHKERVEVKQLSYYYEEMKANIRFPNNREVTIDELINYFQTSEPFIIRINMPYLGNEKYADIESEIKSWAKECIKINSLKDLSDEEKVTYFSKKDLKIKFENAKSTAILKDCKMIEYINNRTFEFLVGEIIFIKEI